METHEFIKDLTGAGFTEHQAEIIARHQALIINENLATKQDIELLRRDIESSRQESKKDIGLLKQDIESSRQESKKDIGLLKQDIESSRQESKKDIESLRQESKQDIESLRQESKQDNELLRKDIIIKLGVMIVGGWVSAIGIILGVMSVMLK